MNHVSAAMLFTELSPDEQTAFLGGLNKIDLEKLLHSWKVWARPDQIAPQGHWATWMIMAGRGFGKTRAGAEWVRGIAENNGNARFALVGANFAEVRTVMVEGDSGLLSIAPPQSRPSWEPSLKRLRWQSGAEARLYSAAEADGLRGPQHSHAWCDEIAKWMNNAGQAVATWDNLKMGLRVGASPQIVATTTPRPVPLVRKLVKDSAVVITKGRTIDNALNLPEAFLTAMAIDYAGTRLGRQELDGELIGELEGALWTRLMIEACQIDEIPSFVRIVVAVDPPASSNGDACGIIVAALGHNQKAYVLADCSTEKPSPEKWARAVADAAALWDADRVIAEANQGGAMVKSVLQAADISLPVKLVHASRGKVARAEPVATLYENDRVHHIRAFPRLEDELCGLMIGGSYEGPGRSPDRADALVWALTELMLGKTRNPNVRNLS
ncbi:MAG: terminase family protein [Parasphingorhabdus sp.]